MPNICIEICIYLHTHIFQMYIYIYIERERERATVISFDSMLNVVITYFAKCRMPSARDTFRAEGSVRSCLCVHFLCSVCLLSCI